MGVDPAGRDQRGPRRHAGAQSYFQDFFNYAGLIRSVWLSTTSPAHVEDITVTTDLDGADGLVRWSAVVAGPGGADVRVALRDEAGRRRGRGHRAPRASCGSPAPRSGSPATAYLYELTVDLVDGERLVDRYRLPVGIRTVRVDGTRFLINGEPFYFRGFGKHEDLAIRGRGHDDVAMVHDYELMTWLGANSFRTSHYPYAEEWLDMADRLGFVVIDETAAVGLNLGVAGGLFGDKPRVTFSDETIGPAAQALHRQAIEELVARDKNHPSVVLWSIANEPESHTPGGPDLLRAALRRGPRGSTRHGRSGS